MRTCVLNRGLFVTAFRLCRRRAAQRLDRRVPPRHGCGRVFGNSGAKGAV